MSLAREISRGFFLNARFGVNGTQNASRSFGTVGASGRVASDMESLLRTDLATVGEPCRPSYQPIGRCGMPCNRRAFQARRMFDTNLQFTRDRPIFLGNPL